MAAAARLFGLRGRPLTHEGLAREPAHLRQAAAKVRYVDGGRAGPGWREDVARAVNRLEELREIAELTELLGPSAVGT